MKHILLFEKWGVAGYLEEQVKEYIEKMSKEKKDQYLFTLFTDKGNYCFYVVIDKFADKNQNGNFHYDIKKDPSGNLRTNNYIITITNREDYATLLHEVKHMDRLIKKDIDKSVISIGHHWTKRLTQDTKVSKKLLSTFYLLTNDEFEAKYHSYYVSLDNYLSKELKGKNPTSDDVMRAVTRFFKKVTDDFSYTWWTDKKNIDLLKLESKSNLIRIFNGFLKGHVRGEEFPKTLDSNTLSQVGKFIKSRLGILNKVDNDNFNKVKKILESELNRNKFNFNRKFRRLYTIMVDKYANHMNENKIFESELYEKSDDSEFYLSLMDGIHTFTDNEVSIIKRIFSDRFSDYNFECLKVQIVNNNNDFCPFAVLEPSEGSSPCQEIKNVVINGDPIHLEVEPVRIGTYRKVLMEIENFTIKISNETQKIYVNKMHDNYFFIMDVGGNRVDKVYVCDYFDGLKKFIDDFYKVV
jgi:hypothetical protein